MCHLKNKLFCLQTVRVFCGQSQCGVSDLCFQGTYAKTTYNMNETRWLNRRMEGFQKKIKKWKECPDDFSTRLLSSLVHKITVMSSFFIM